MNFINPPAESPQYVTHRTFYSKLVDHEVGFNIYLPPDYEHGVKRYPVAYHLHGYTGNESSDIWTLEKVYKSRDTITVFANGTSSDNGYLDNELPIESIIITELIPSIDAQYRTVAIREGRSISGFSMGGAGAFYYAVKYPEIFGSVTAYAGTYHHFYHKGSHTVGVAPEKAAELYENMMREERYLENDGILYLVK
ncbi:MAG: alpha/beta hydrolase, partial [Ruminiclostridium sp.]